MLISDWSSDVCPSDLGVRARQLRDIRSRRLLLRCRLREDRRTIARPAIRPLPVELRGIVRDREIDAQQRAVAHSGRIVGDPDRFRSEEHTSELQSLMRISYAVFCLKKKKKT